MHESALFLLGLLVAESSVCHAVRRLHTVPSTLVPRVCMYPRAYPTPRCETSHTHARRVDRREKGGWSSACERQLRSTSLLKGVWQIRWGNTDGSLVFCPSFLLFSLLSFFLLFLSLFLIPFHSVSFFRKRWDEREREREGGRGRKTASMFGNDPEPLKRIDVSQEFILIYGNGRWRPPGESFCSPINYSRPVDVDLWLVPEF